MIGLAHALKYLQNIVHILQRNDFLIRTHAYRENFKNLMVSDIGFDEAALARTLRLSRKVSQIRAVVSTY
jgi:hypothetical protein